MVTMIHGIMIHTGMITIQFTGISGIHGVITHHGAWDFHMDIHTIIPPGTGRTGITVVTMTTGIHHTVIIMAATIMATMDIITPITITGKITGYIMVPAEEHPQADHQRA